MGELSMAEQTLWIERLFKRMGLHYGAAFTQKWLGVASIDMKEHWANELSGFTGEAIARALKSLDSHEFPPSVPEFKTLCKSFQKSPELPKLEILPMSSNEAESALKNLRAVTGIEMNNGDPCFDKDHNDYKKWARDIIKLWDEGKYRTRVGYRLACEALHLTPKPAPYKFIKEYQHAN